MPLIAHIFLMVMMMMVWHVMMMVHMARIRSHIAKCMIFATFIHYTFCEREVILMINHMFVNCCNMCWLYMWHDRMDVIGTNIFFWWQKMWWVKLSWACLWWTTMWTFCMVMHTFKHVITSCFDKLWFILKI